MRSKKLKLFAVGFLFVAMATSAIAASSVPGKAADPVSAQLDRYPLQAGPLSTMTEASLDLKPMKLAMRWTGYNYYRGLRGGRWVLETLPAGTLVLADRNLNPIYKADCGNRLVSIPICPACAKTTDTGSNGAGIGTNTQAADSDFWSQHPYLSKLWDFVKAAWLWMLGLLALFLLAALTFLALREFSRWLDRRNEPTPPAIPPAQPARVAPAPAAAGAAQADPPAAATPVGRRFVSFHRSDDPSQPHILSGAGYGHTTLTDHDGDRFTIHIRE